MRRLALSAALMLGLLGAKSGKELTDPAMMANAIREAGYTCNAVKSLQPVEDSSGREYDVVCDKDIKYRIFLNEDDTVRVENR